MLVCSKIIIINYSLKIYSNHIFIWTVITGTNPAIRQYIDPDFVAPGNPGNQQGPVVSDSIFCIDAGNRSHQIYLHVIRRLQAAYLQNNAPEAPSLGRVFWVTSPRANTLQIDETYNVFTF